MAILQTVIAAKANITGGAFEALAGQGGDTLTVAYFTQGNAWLIDAYGINSANAFEFDIRSPRLHDPTRGIRIAGTPVAPGAAGANGCYLLTPWSFRQQLYPGDTLTVEVNATATNNAVLALNILYDSLQPTNVNFLSPAQVRSQIANLVSFRVNPTASGTAGAYGTARALSADDPRMIAGKKYALLGMETSIPIVSAQVQGPDTGNYRIGIPGFPNPQIGAEWLVQLSERENLPFIPVIDALNAGNTTVTVIDAAASTAPVLDLWFAELR
jgi:hypothetical protein